MKKNLILIDPNKNAKPLESPVDTASKSLDNFVGCNGSAFKIDEANKRFYIWIYGQIVATQRLLKIISLLHTIPEDYTGFMHLHTPGGSVVTACNLLTAMERCKATLITHNMGMAASCGSLILAFGDKIAISPLSITMFHNAIGGGYDSIHRTQTRVNHTVERINDIFRKLIGRGIVTEDEIAKIVSNGEEFFIPSDIIIDRLRNCNLLYEGEM